MDGPNFRDELIITHLPIVRAIVNKMAMRLPPYIEKDDLYSSGVMGLIDAAGKFDGREDVKFRTYAEFRIRGAIRDDLRALDWTPRHYRELVTAIEKARVRLEHELLRAPSDSDLAEEMGISIEEVGDIHRAAKLGSLLSLDLLMGLDCDGDVHFNLLEKLCDEQALAPVNRMDGGRMRRDVVGAVNALPGKQRTVAWLYYFERLPMRAIAEILEVTESRVSQIHRLALAAMRSSLIQWRDAA